MVPNEELQMLKKGLLVMSTSRIGNFLRGAVWWDCGLFWAGPKLEANLWSLGCENNTTLPAQFNAILCPTRWTLNGQVGGHKCHIMPDVPNLLFQKSSSSKKKWSSLIDWSLVDKFWDSGAAALKGRRCWIIEIIMWLAYVHSFIYSMFLLSAHLSVVRITEMWVPSYIDYYYTTDIYVVISYFRYLL